MWTNDIMLGLIGLAAGFIIAGGTFAFITWIGIITRFATKTNTAEHMMFYEDMVVLGAGFGNIIFLYHFEIPLGIPGVAMFGLFSGIFEGCLSVALAEVIQTFPVFVRRVKLKVGTSYILLCLALGKALGTIIQVFF